MKANRADAYRLFHEGALALSVVEQNGIKIDLPYLNGALESCDAQIKQLTAELRSDPIFKLWQKQYGQNMNLDSGPQLACILYDKLKYPISSRSAKTGRAKVDESALEDIDVPFIKKYVKIKKLKKLRATNIRGILREVNHKGILRPFQNLQTARTYRSSQSDPNGQNIPARDEELARIIRSAFIPRNGRWFVEVDFKGAEVCNGACYHKDPRMIEYILDPSKDMHRDIAAQLFKLKKSDVPKTLRQEIKGDFVFAEFYGAYCKTCAPRIWKQITRRDIKLADGTPLMEHLENATGVTELGECDSDSRDQPQPGTFEFLCWKVERDMWDNRFRGYRDWKNDWFARYLKRGYFDMLTGFRCSGVFNKKEVCNYPIQGAAFHCLLWSLIRLNRWLQKYKMKSLIIGQIHDSMLLDVTEAELQDVIHRITTIIKIELPKHWPWIIVPLTVEIEASRENWFKKKPLELAA